MKLYRVFYRDREGGGWGSLVRSSGLVLALYRFFEKYPELEDRVTDITVTLVEGDYID